jgi:hypothetical protein
MDPQALIELVTEDEGLTGDLDEEGASCLVRELSDAVRKIVASSASEEQAGTRVANARKNGRALARMAAKVQDGDLDAARQMAGAQGWAWPAAGVKTAAELISALRDKLAG